LVSIRASRTQSFLLSRRPSPNIALQWAFTLGKRAHDEHHLGRHHSG
jgi:hypothetical protein